MKVDQLDKFFEFLDKNNVSIPKDIHLNGDEFRSLRLDMMSQNWSGYLNLVYIDLSKIEFVNTTIFCTHATKNQYTDSEGTSLKDIPFIFLEFFNNKEEDNENVQKHKCTCNIQTLMSKGCQCDGI